MNKHDWSTALREYATQCRNTLPIPDRESLSLEQEWHCRIIGGSFMDWLERHSTDMMKQRNVLRLMKDFDPSPIVVFTTSLPGLIAGQIAIPRPSDSFVMLRQTEFDAWNATHPVDSFTFHVQHWSYFERLTPEVRAKAQAEFPHVEPAAFRAHADGHLWGERCGVGGVHLWEWTGSEMNLLEEAFTHVVY